MMKMIITALIKTNKCTDMIYSEILMPANIIPRLYKNYIKERYKKMKHDTA